MCEKPSRSEAAARVPRPGRRTRHRGGTPLAQAGRGRQRASNQQTEGPALRRPRMAPAPVQCCESGSKVPGAAIISIARLRSCSAVVAAAPAVSKLARAQTVRLWSRGAVEKNLEADGRRGTAENGGVEPKRATAQGDETANPQVHDSPVQLRATPSAIK
jgi:hypothetical protein